MAGGTIKKQKDIIVDDIPLRNKAAQSWGMAHKGRGILVNNAFKDFPAPGQGDATVVIPGTHAFYKWDGTAFKKINALSKEEIDTLSELNAIVNDEDLVSKRDLFLSHNVNGNSGTLNQTEIVEGSVTVQLTNGSSAITSTNGAFALIYGRFWSVQNQGKFWIKDGSTYYFVATSSGGDDNNKTIQGVYSGVYTGFISNTWPGNTGTYSIIFDRELGVPNVNSGFRSFVIGSSNTNKGDHCIVLGNNNTFSFRNSLLVGRNLPLQGINGTDSIMAGRFFFPPGSNTTVDGSIAVGSGHTFKFNTGSAAIFGDSHVSQNSGIFAAGNIHKVFGQYSALFGTRGQSGFDYRAATFTQNNATIAGVDVTAEYANTTSAQMYGPVVGGVVGISSVVFTGADTVINFAAAFPNFATLTHIRSGQSGLGSIIAGEGTSTRNLLGHGRYSYNFSSNTAAQTLGHGVLANQSAALGGINTNIPADSPRTVVLGGNGIKARAADPDQVYVSNLNIVVEPSNDNALTQLLVRDSATGKIKHRLANSFVEAEGTPGAAAPAAGTIGVKINGITYNLLHT